MKRFKRAIAVASAAAVMITCVSGCKTQNDETNGNLDLKALAESSYPLKTDQKIKWWSYRGGSVYGGYNSPTEMPSLADYEKAIGVDIDWTFAVSGQETQQFNLLLASGDIPDIVGYYWTYNDIPGGPDKAIKDGYLAALNDLIPTYAPAYNEYLEENPSAKRELTTDEGNYFYFPSYTMTEEEAKINISSGYMFRKDWLDDLNLPVPETVDDWYKTLKAFKEKKNASAPFSISYANLSRGLPGAWGIGLPTYKEGTTVKYGYAEPAYKEFLMEMNKWYKEGLLDKSFASIDSKGIDAKIINGDSGASFGWAQSGFVKWTNAARVNNPDFELVGVSYPVMNRGEISTFAPRDPQVYFAGCAIGQKSKNKELATKILDYGFTQEGRERMMFGIENDTFTIENGEYKLTDKILANKDGLSEAEAKSIYIRNDQNIPLLNSNLNLRAKVVETFSLPELETAVKSWRNNEGDKSRLPATLAPSLEDATEYGRILTDLNSYASEMMLKFIVGETPFSEYDNYLAELERRGLHRMLEIAQASYDRYLAR